jgi:hypothetical protein
MPTTMTAEAQLGRDARRYATLFAILFWLGALWLFSQFYVPLKGWGAAWYGGDTAAWQEANRTVLRATLQSLPAFALLGALRTAEKLFGRLGDGPILTLEGGEGLRAIGTWLLVAGILGLVGVDGDGSQFDLHFSVYFRPDLILAAVGLAVRYVGQVWVMAAGIKAEHDQIV